MLPKLFSNIILAVIAIFVLYTFAPLLKEILGSIFGQGSNKKKSLDKNEFDEMVRRKADQMSSVARNQGIAKSGKKKTSRNEWDYLIEKKYFASDEDLNYLQDLKKSLEWGANENTNSLKKNIEKSLSLELSDSIFTSTLRKALTKNSILDTFPSKNISKESYNSKFGVLCFIEILNSNKDDLYQSLSKKLIIDVNAIEILLKVSLLPNKDGLINHLEAYIDNEELTLDLNALGLKKFESIKEILNTVKKNLDTVIPLIALNKKSIKSDIFNNQKDKDLLKKKYKKVVSIYHPDKWSYFDKTESIDKRLRDNFNLIQETYDIMNKD